MERKKVVLAAGALAPATAPARVKLAPQPEPQVYAPESSVEFMPSGSTMLDRVLGGGWAIGRVANLVGDKSSGKTLLAIELCALWANTFGVDSIRYVEAEAAFDEGYARTIGMPDGLRVVGSDPTERVETVEQWHDDLEAFLASRGKNDGPCLYILDSLDALSDAAEMERDIDKGSYGAAKAKKISELFRKLIATIAEKNCLLLIISQIRDKIGVTFGETKTRSGGRALDFYASQVIWLAEIGKLKRQVLGAERVIGAKVLAKSKKNKVGPPFREAEMTIIFQYGVDDEVSMLEWLHKNKATNLLRAGSDEKRIKDIIAKARQAGDRDIINDVAEDLRSAVHTHWMRIEELLAPPMKKYGG